MGHETSRQVTPIEVWYYLQCVCVGSFIPRYKCQWTRANTLLSRSLYSDSKTVHLISRNDCLSVVVRPSVVASPVYGDVHTQAIANIITIIFENEPFSWLPNSSQGGS